MRTPLRHSYKVLIFSVSFFLYNSHVLGQAKKNGDTSITFSITVFNKKNKKREINFPDVYPNISNLYFIENEHMNDTIFCSYDFPALKISKAYLDKIKGSKNVTLNFYYDYIREQHNNNRYLISIPIKFPLIYEGAKFIVIEHLKKNKFFGMQKWGSTIYTGELLKSFLIY